MPYTIGYSEFSIEFNENKKQRKKSNNFSPILSPKEISEISGEKFG